MCEINDSDSFVSYVFGEGGFFQLQEPLLLFYMRDWLTPWPTPWPNTWLSYNWPQNQTNPMTSLMTNLMADSWTTPCLTPKPTPQSGVSPHLHFQQTRIYKTHIYTKPRFTQTQIYTAPYWHAQIYITQIYTKLNPNLQRHKFTLCQTVQRAKLGRIQVVLCAATPLTLRVATATGALSFLN